MPSLVLGGKGEPQLPDYRGPVMGHQPGPALALALALIPSPSHGRDTEHQAAGPLIDKQIDNIYII